MESAAPTIAATLERQLEELDRLITTRDKISDNITTAKIEANIRVGSIFFTHHKLEEMVRAGINEVMNALVADQRTICQGTKTRLEEAMALMGVAPSIDPPPPDTRALPSAEHDRATH